MQLLGTSAQGGVREEEGQRVLTRRTHFGNNNNNNNNNKLMMEMVWREENSPPLWVEMYTGTDTMQSSREVP